jgi:diguanylate cyclase (GGDEF)-like protein
MGRLRSDEQMRHEALHDPLTGLANRALCRERLIHALARSGRDDGAACVLFIDLDDFKGVNDLYGHAAGDALLIALARRLVATVRPADTVARLGGDEFVVVAEGVSAVEDQSALAARVQAVLDQPIDVGGRAVRSGASVGVAVAGPDADARSVLREADAAMYRAKARGRGRYEMSHGTRVGALNRT